MDTLLTLLPRFGFSTSVFYRGDFCGQNQFRASDGVGQLHLVRKGTVHMLHRQGPPLHVLEPSLVFYPRAFDHQLVVPAGEPVSLLCANVRFAHATHNPIAQALPDVMCVPLAGADGLSATLELLMAEEAADDIGKELIVDGLCGVLVVHLIRHAWKANMISKGVLAGLSDLQLAPVLSALHADPGRPWPLQDMAALARMSRTTFINRFRDVVGMAPARYLTGWRMNLARSLLLEGRSVKEVALTVGYRHQPAFSKAFSSWCGMAPTEWLRQPS
ncbi:AraC family transcriptional regulator [Pseudoduganella sp. GCM10020061]|uniref:helix-turn-helix transcriptional regulator n=1 Tax=Pseudoduganella sp. GCM10020061 TaxID=3317345 RepID=UPI0036279A9D